MRVGSLFAGIGGFDLAARWMGWNTVWYSEIDPYASAVMRKNFPQAENHGDITLIDGKAVGPVDLLCGGFPCQDISLAGKGAGITGARSGLWYHYARLIEEIKPKYVLAENVSALRSRGLDRVLRDLMALGYDAEWHCIPASYVGAPHRRDRIWITAYLNAHNAGQSTLSLNDEARWLSRSGTVADAYGERGCLRDTNRQDAENARQPSGRSVYRQWDVEPNVGRVANGVPSRVDRLKCLGNAIVPQVAFTIFQAIQAAEDRRLTA